MFVLSFSPRKLGKKGIAVIAGILSIVVISIIVLVSHHGPKTSMVYGDKEYSLCAKTEEERISFLKSIACETNAKADAVTKVTIPKDFNAVYTEYNELQKAVGFDLMPYGGTECLQYTYNVNNANTPTQVNLLVYDNVIIGGDIQQTETNSMVYALLDKNIMICPKNNNSKIEESSVYLDPSEVSSTERATLAPDPNMPEAPTD
ncbi:MAG: DUF4830 domain-containing protein [Acutalibacteraceae bacterium]